MNTWAVAGRVGIGVVYTIPRRMPRKLKPQISSSGDPDENILG